MDITDPIENGGSITLDEGCYRISRPLVLGGNLELKGRGPQSLIELDFDAPIALKTDHFLTLDNLSIKLKGQIGTGLWIGGAYSICDVHLQGSNGLPSPRQYSGICLNHHAHGAITHSHFSWLVQGVEVRDNAGATLRINHFSQNCIGIAVLGKARVLLEGNTCQDNISGISFSGKAKGRVTSNTCTRNYQAIHITQEAKVAALGNTCQLSGIGISFADEASGSAQYNYCWQNEIAIRVVDSAKPQIKGNVCLDNRFNLLGLD